MAKRELIDKAQVLTKIKQNLDKEFLVRTERDFLNCVEDAPTITEQDIVKPYLDKITEHLGNLIDENMEIRGSTIEPNQYAYCYQEIIEFVCNLLSEQGDTE